MNWRYLIELPGTGQPSYADVSEENHLAHFISLSQNRSASALIEADQIAETAAEVLEGDCELRTLEVPALKLSCVWLTNRSDFFSFPTLTEMLLRRLR